MCLVTSQFSDQLLGKSLYRGAYILNHGDFFQKSIKVCVGSNIQYLGFQGRIFDAVLYYLAPFGTTRCYQTLFRHYLTLFRHYQTLLEHNLDTIGHYQATSRHYQDTIRSNANLKYVPIVENPAVVDCCTNSRAEMQVWKASLAEAQEPGPRPKPGIDAAAGRFPPHTNGAILFLRAGCF